MKYTPITLSLFLITTCLAGCRTTKGTDLKDDRKLSSPQTNIVQTITLKRETFSQQIVTNGKVRASRKADLHFRTSGTVQKLLCHNGQSVSKGDTIAVLDREDLLLSLLSATTNFKKARLDYYDILAGQGYSPKDTAAIPSEVLSMAKMRSGYSGAQNALQRAEYDCSSAILYAPFSGKIANLSSAENEQTPGDRFCTLIDDSRYDVDFNVMESEYSFATKARSIRISPFTNSDISIAGTIRNINPSVDDNGQIEIRASAERNDILLDGMNVKVIIEKSIPNQLTVPRSALVIRDGFDVLFTYTPDGTAHWIYVIVMDKNSESAIVKANSERGSVLNEGDEIIISGNLNLADGSKVTIL